MIPGSVAGCNRLKYEPLPYMEGSTVTEEGIMPSILIVCTANVCRSPLAAIRLRMLLDEAGLSQQILTDSAGSAAVGGGVICSSTRARLSARPGETDAAEHHVSKRLTRTMLTDAGLVLVPDLPNRARVVALEPTVRRRTFTLQEAARFAPSTPSEAPTGLITEHDVDAAFVRWVAAMNARRTSAPPLEAPRFSVRRHAVQGIEIADGHNLGTRLHRETMDAVDSACAEIADALASARPAREPGPGA